jgi:hypothetical protein
MNITLSIAFILLYTPSKLVMVGPKTSQIKDFPYFFIVWLKENLSDTFIWFQICRIIFVLHFNTYFVTVGHCPGRVGTTKNEGF